MINSKNYWENRYKKGGNSGNGSYNNLAQFKADVINKFIKNNKINNLLELGCGDGNQLQYLNVDMYNGYDIAPTAIKLCNKKYINDTSKCFYNDLKYVSNCELTISLEVIFHLIEDNVFEEYMTDLFNMSMKYVIIYSSNTENSNTVSHVKHRKFSNWIKENKKDWNLIETISNKYPYAQCGENGSFSDFFIYQKNI